MIKRRALAAALALAAVPSVSADAQKVARPDLAAFDSHVARAARDWQVPALAIAIVKDDSLVFAKGYGVLELGKPARANEHTRFAIGSTTKAMTTAALAMLVDEGKVRWDDRVIDYIPELRLYDAYVTRELTIRDLLTHRSGLPGTDLLWLRADYTLPEMMRRLRYVKPASSFRSEWMYQNVVYAIAGEIVARVSGTPWDRFVRSRIFTPLGMNETEPLVADIAGKPNVATPHALLRDTVRVVPVRTTDPIAAVGSVWSSVSDMSKWMRFMLDSGRLDDKRLIAPATFAEIVAPQIRAPMAEYPALRLARPNFFSYALGWFVQDYRGETVWMHTGSIDGMCAIIGLMPDKRLGVYVLENLDHAELRHALMYDVFDLYNGNPSRDWSADVQKLFADIRAGTRQRAIAAADRTTQSAKAATTAPALPLDRYAGTYTDSTYGDVSVVLDNGSLRARFGKEDLGKLEPWQYDTFRAHGPPPLEQVVPITFISDGMGGVASLRLYGVQFGRVREPARLGR